MYFHLLDPNIFHDGSIATGITPFKNTNNLITIYVLMNINFWII